MSLSAKIDEVISTDTLRQATDAALDYAVTDAWTSLVAFCIIGCGALCGALVLYRKADECAKPMAYWMAFMGVFTLSIGILSTIPKIANPQGYIIYSAIKK